MMHAHVNYLAVLVAAVVAMVIGFVWYSPAVFGNLWMRIIGKDTISKAEAEQMQKDTKPYFAFMFIAAFAGAAILARFIVWLGVTTLGGGLRIGFLAWLGFAVPIALGNALFSGKDKSLVWPMFFVQAGHELAGLLVTGAILGIWH